MLANVILEDAFSLFLALSDREFLTEKSFLDYLLNKFREMDEEESGGEYLDFVVFAFIIYFQFCHCVYHLLVILFCS